MTTDIRGDVENACVPRQCVRVQAPDGKEGIEHTAATSRCVEGAADVGLTVPAAMDWRCAIRRGEERTRLEGTVRVRHELQLTQRAGEVVQQPHVGRDGSRM